MKREADRMGFKPTCREVHRLSSEGLDRELSLVERVRMRVHLMVCQACRNFTGQLNLIRRAVRHDGPPAEADPGRERP
jgi:predicted anti-sigma-YlaC factor YlaD